MTKVQHEAILAQQTAELKKERDALEDELDCCADTLSRLEEAYSELRTAVRDFLMALPDLSSDMHVSTCLLAVRRQLARQDAFLPEEEEYDFMPVIRLDALFAAMGLTELEVDDVPG
jgi:hypothetical protein